MRRTNWILWSLSAAIFTCAAGASAQAPPPPPAGKHVPNAPMARDGGPGPMFQNLELLGFDSLAGHEVVKGAPFSATAVSETTQVLADGNRIHRSSKTQVFRDAEGRVRREISFQNIGPLVADGRTHTFIMISDPVAGTGFRLHPDDKSAWKFFMPPARGEGRMRERFGNRAATLETSGNLKTETLGTQLIEGVSAEGTRYTFTLGAGQVGNDKPIQMVTERWYSNELQVMVMVKRTDPRFGESSYRLTNIQQQTQDPTLFQVPADYSLKDEGRRMRRPGGDKVPLSPPPPPPGF